MRISTCGVSIAIWHVVPDVCAAVTPSASLMPWSVLVVGGALVAMPTLLHEAIVYAYVTFVL